MTYLEELIEARVRFSRAFADLVTFAWFLCEQAGKEEDCEYAVVIDQTKRTKREARWNADHCRVVEDGQRCERTMVQHSGRGDHDFKPIGIAESTHGYGLAGDLIILRNGKTVDDPTLYASLGRYWRAKDTRFCWGGDFIGFKDLGHFSHEWRGRK